MKAYTDIEQSRKLTEILPIESADMVWILFNPDLPTIKVIAYKDSEKCKYYETLPAWSLAALLNVLPQSVRLVGTPKDSYWYCECIDDNNHWYAGFGSANNPVGACVEMILKLHERKML